MDIDNYSLKAKWLILTSPRDKAEGIIQLYILWARGK